MIRLKPHVPHPYKCIWLNYYTSFIACHYISEKLFEMQNCVNAVKRYHFIPLGSQPNEARRIDELPDASVAVLLVAVA